ncbi:hypothetical protein ACQY0O_006403 [Thecaphora frezii]
MDRVEDPKAVPGRLEGLDLYNLPVDAPRLHNSSLAVSPSYSDLSLDEKLRKIGRPLKPLPRRASNGKSPASGRRQLQEQGEADLMDLHHQASHISRMVYSQHGSMAPEGDAADLSGNSYPSPATPTHVPSFYQGTFDKDAARAAEASLVDHLSEAVFRAKLDSDDRTVAAAAAADAAQRLSPVEPEPNSFKFRDLPISMMNQGFYYRQRMAQIVLSCADEAKAAHFALMSRYYMKPFEQGGPPPAPHSSREAGSVGQNVAASTVSGDDCCGDESDGCDDSGAEFAWLENTGNKKKRKSARSSEGSEVVPANAQAPVSVNGSGVSTLAGGAVPAEGFGASAGVTPIAPRLPLPIKSDGTRREPFQLPDTEIKVPPPRLILSKSRIPYSSRGKASQREKLRMRFRRIRARRLRMREEEEAAREAEAQELAEEAERQARLAAEKKPPKRLTKAERKAQARRGGSGAPKPMSIAAIRAARSDQSHNLGQGANPSQSQTQAQPTSAAPARSTEAPRTGGSMRESVASGGARAETTSAAGRTEKVDSEDEVEFLLGSDSADGTSSLVEVPQCAFEFAVKSPIADSLEALRASMSAVSLQINNSLGPLDGSFADVMNRAALNGSADLPPRALLDPTVAPLPLRSIPPSQGATRATTPSVATPTTQRALSTPPSNKAFAASANQAPSAYAHASPSVKARAPVTAATGTIGATTTATSSSAANVAPAAPPLHSPPPKLTRRKKATMNNVHHRANYVPSRMPSDGPRQTKKNGGDKAQPPGLDHPSTTCGLFDGEWMCVFCEYELLYGEPPLMFRACRSRKKIVANRKRAQARARRAAEGGSTAAAGEHHPHTEHAHDAYDAPKKKGSGSGAKGAARTSRPSHSHQRERCSCGNSIHESDEGSSTYSHSAPGSPMMERSKNGSRDSHLHGHHHSPDGHGHHGGYDTSPRAAAAAANEPHHRARHPASPSPPPPSSSAAATGGKANGKAKAAVAATAATASGGFDPNDYASVFAAMTKDKASQAAIARYIASGGKTTPPPVMMPPPSSS